MKCGPNMMVITGDLAIESSTRVTFGDGDGTKA
jgi:hypothetical protein